MADEAPANPAAADPEPPDSYTFVLNVGRLIDAPSYTLAPGHELRRATAEEIVRIKATLQGFGSPPLWLSDALWEIRLPMVIFGERLPEPEWRYFVIAFRGSQDAALQSALDLALLEIEVGFTIPQVSIPSSRALSIHPGRLFHVMEDGVRFVDVSARDAEAIRAIHALLQGHDNGVVNVERLAIQLGQLKALPHGSPLRFLGYFGVLESLLTHKPKLTDPYDSITRQVKKKLALLDNRWFPRIDYAPFGQVKPDVVWSQMYDYRSGVAHGDAPRLGILRTHDAALTLIKETVKAVIRHALADPQLLRDLKDC
jgi:hypothetical protein